MSRYPIKYHSSSKGDIDIEDMATPHLMNAWRKMGGTSLSLGPAPEGIHALAVVNSLGLELVARGCTLDPETGRWTLPPKEEP